MLLLPLFMLLKISKSTWFCGTWSWQDSQADSLHTTHYCGFACYGFDRTFYRMLQDQYKLQRGHWDSNKQKYPLSRTLAPSSRLSEGASTSSWTVCSWSRSIWIRNIRPPLSTRRCSLRRSLTPWRCGIRRGCEAPEMSDFIDFVQKRRPDYCVRWFRNYSDCGNACFRKIWKTRSNKILYGQGPGSVKKWCWSRSLLKELKSRGIILVNQLLVWLNYWKRSGI